MKKTNYKISLLRIIPVVCIMIIALLVGSGCQTMTGLHDPDVVRLQTDMEWLSPPLSMGLREVPSAKKVVYLRVRNSSGSPVFGLYEQIAGQLSQAGYTVSQNIEDSHFSLVADVRYFGETRDIDGAKGLLTGAAVGAAGGAILGHNIGSGSGDRDKAAAAGAIAGGLVGDALARRNRIITYSLAVDIRIGERIDGGVQTTRSSTAGGQVSGEAAAGMGSRVEQASDRAGSSQDQSVRVEENFLYHNNRILASAKKMNLTVEEAMPVVGGRISTAVASALP